MPLQKLKNHWRYIMPKDIEKQAQSALDASISSLDPNTTKALSDIRQQALNPSKPSRSFNYWLPSAAFSIALALVWVINPQFSAHDLTSPEMALASEMTLEDPDMLNELEFYYWLEQANENS